MSWRQYRDTVRHLTLGLRHFGFGPGQAAVLLARNRPEHVLADAAVVHAGGVPVSVYTTASPEQFCHVVSDSQATTAIVERDLLEVLGDVRSRLPSIARVVIIDGPGTGDDAVAWADVVAAGRSHDDPDEFDLAAAAVQPDDPAALVYTSGTEGPPKGAVHTHRTILWTLEAISRRAVLDADDRLVSYLPLAHSVERWWSHWRGMVRGAPTSFCSDGALLVATLIAVRPTWFLAMPRTWEKLERAVAGRVAAEPDAAHRRVLEEALEVGRKVVDAEQQGAPAAAEVRDRHAELRPHLTSVLAAFGLDACRVAVSGGAPIAGDVVKTFHAMGLPVSEGWGMTELMVGTWNGLDRIRIGTVGPTLPGVEAELAPDGEMLVRGGGTMIGYHGNQPATARILDAGGWLRTGDVAEVDDDGYVRIVGRKKEIVITSGGTNVWPGEIEQLVQEHPLVGGVCVVGDNRPYLCALVALDADATRSWAKRHGVEAVDVVSLAANPLVVAEVGSAFDAANRRLARPQQVKRYAIVPEQWTVEGGDLTPTLKIRRVIVCARHADEIEGMYQ
jgi:long-chain acyl-CoA synthetase